MSKRPKSDAEVKAQIRRILDPSEFRRIENIIDIILRDREIKRQFRDLRRQIGSYRAIDKLAAQFYLSPERINAIVYNKDRFAELQLEMYL